MKSYPYNAFQIGKYAIGASAASRAYMSKANKQVSDTIAGNSRVYTGRVARRIGSSRSFAARVRSLSSYHHNNIADSANNTNMTHNTIYTSSITPKVGQGDTNATRTGNSIFSRMIFAQGVFTLNASADEDTVRVIVFSDKQQIGDTTPGVTDVLTSANINSPLNVLTLGRFQILKDFKRTFTSAGVNRGTYKFAIPMRHHVRYNGTASSDVQKGGLFVLLIGSQPTNTLNHSAEWRLTFYDN